MPKKEILIVLASTLLVVLAAFAIKTYLPTGPGPSSSPVATVTPKSLLYFSLVPSTSNVKVGDKVSVDVFLSGDEVENVSGYDLMIDYDNTKLKLDKATKGEFFASYLEVKWDLAQSWFAATYNPSSKDSVPNSKSPIIKLEFSALAPSASTSISIKPKAMVVSKTSTSGSYPSSNEVLLKIE